MCGRVLGYQNHLTLAFRRLLIDSRSIDQNYLSGVSLTHGNVGSRQHVWSFASAIGEPARGPHYSIHAANLCDCSNKDSWPFNTSFIGNDYFCDSGNEGLWENKVYVDDPLWDGAGCGPTSTCCQFNNPPWFYKTLPRYTTDDLEVRICDALFLASIGDTPISLIELYIQ